MYCPKCAAPLVEREQGNGKVVGWCKPGNMWFSEAAWAMTVESFGPNSVPQKIDPRDGTASTWFCPADGQSMVGLDGLRCAVCGRVMPSRLWHALVFLHPHGISDEEILGMRRAREEQEAPDRSRDSGRR